jgi:glycosyltransferase involved in cell wall biosynthesis
MARLRESNLRLCLIGDGLLRPACEQRVRELGLEESIEFTGWLPRAAVVQRLKNADVAAAPFLKIEPFYFDPVKVLEYMAAGLPIIASDIQRIAEMLDFGRVGLLVPPGDAAALAEAMLALARDAPLRLRLGKAARDMVESGSSRQDIAKDVMALCREAAAKNLRSESKRRMQQGA